MIVWRKDVHMRRALLLSPAYWGFDPFAVGRGFIEAWSNLYRVGAELVTKISTL